MKSIIWAFISFFLILFCESQKYEAPGLKMEVDGYAKNRRGNYFRSMKNVNQNYATGTSFVFSFLNSHVDEWNTDYQELLAIIITNPGDRDANVHVASPYVNFTDFDITITAGTSKEIPIEPNDIQTDYMDGNRWDVGVIENKILTVDSSAPILLVASNTHNDLNNGDKYVIFPICQLGKEYHIVADEAQTFWQELSSTNIFTVIATEDQTTIKIPTITNGTVISKGQQYTFADYYTVTNLVVSADKPVAVLSGAICGFGYWNPNSCNHEAVMLYPTDNWDTVIPYFKFRPSDEGEVMILIKENGTDLSADGKLIFRNLTELNYIIANIGQGIYFTATKPIYGVAVGSENRQGQGAPFFVHLPSPKNFISDGITFATGLDSIETRLVHYVRVVTEISNIGTITVDNYTVNGLLYTRMGRSNYYFRDVFVQTGQHSVAATGNATFAVTVYGFGDDREYAFIPGINLMELCRGETRPNTDP